MPLATRFSRREIGRIAVALVPAVPAAWLLRAARWSEAATAAAAAGRVERDVSYGPHERNVMDLYLPDTAKAGPRPLVVCIHGGGWAGGDKRVYAWLGEALARR